jgi:membrane protease YdiL (CAAX protease family)
LNGRWTWLVHGIFWALWHFPMGLDLVFASLPIFFILPAIVQLRKNTSVAIVIHFVFGAMGFLVLAFGLVK